MSRAAVAKELVVAQARSLKMPGVVRVFESLARQAREEHWGYEEFLHEVLCAEQTSRRDSAVRHRLRDARFPEIKTIDTFDFAATDGTVSATQIAELARGECRSRTSTTTRSLHPRRGYRPIAARGARRSRARASSTTTPASRTSCS